MKNNYIKKVLAVLLSVIFFGNLSPVTVLAAPNLPSSEITPLDAGYYEGKLWEFKSRSYTGDTNGSKIYISQHTAGPDGAGESLSVSYGLGLSASFSGAISASSANKVAGEFGYSIGINVNLEVSRNSRALKANEKVTAYAVPVYKLYNVVEREISYTLNNGTYIKYEPTGKTRSGSVKVPKTIDVQFVYSSARMTANGLTEEITRIETYSANKDGVYQLANTIYLSE